MYLGSQISECIWWIGSGNNFTPDISEQLQISNVKEAYQTTTCVIYSGQILQQNA